MKTMTMKQIVVGVKEYFLMALGMVFYSFGWVGCVMPAHGIGGGAAGLALVVSKAFEQMFGIHILVGTMSFLINGILLLVAGFIIGWKFGIKTIYCIAWIAMSMNIMQQYLPVEGVFVGMENILLIIMGGVCCGVGIALAFKQGGSTGGVDIVSMIINKYHTVRYGNIVMCCDSAIIASSLLVGSGLTTVIYGFIMTAVFGYTVDMLMSGNQQSNQVMIVSHKYDEVADAVMQTVRRGVTMLDSVGAYTKSPSKVVMVICRKNETSMLLKAVKSVDPDAFMSVGSVMGVYGKGFQPLMK